MEKRGDKFHLVCFDITLAGKFSIYLQVMMNDIEMINTGNKRERDTKRIEWINGSDFWLALFLGHLILIIFLIVVYINTPKAFFFFCTIVCSPVFVLPLLSPKRIIIDRDILSILLIGRSINIGKSDIAKISAFKLRVVHGRLYYFKIISKSPLSIRFCYEMFPIFIKYDLKPYHNLEPSRIYDIVEEIENWFKKDKFVK